MPRRRARVREGPLTREAIVRAALALVDEAGLDALSMRRLGAALGVEAMSLYSHFRDKEELLDGVQEAVLGEIDPDLGRGDWRERLARAGRAFRRALERHPNALPLFATRIVHTPRAMALVEKALVELKRAGLSDLHAIYAFDAVTCFIIAHAMAQWGGRHTDAQLVAHELSRLAELPPEQFPTMAGMLPALAGYSFDDGFELGLQCVLEGIAQHARARTRRPAGRRHRREPARRRMPSPR